MRALAWSLAVLVVAAPARAASRWCADDLEALDDETCIARPDPARPSRSVVVFLHGVLPPGGRGPDAERVQRIAIHAAQRAGYAAIVPRGVPGIGPGPLKAWWAWPTSSRDYAAHASAVLASWARKKRALEELTGGAFARTYVAGSSSGAYFVVALAMRGAFAADGWAATSGGAPLFDPRSDAPRAPFYVGYGTLDPSRSDPVALVDLLRRVRWPHKVTTHPLTHGAGEPYLDDAFAYWDSASP